MHRVLVLGGYGFFDTRICATLATESAIEPYVAGRYDTKACRFPMRITIKPAFGSG